MSETEHATLVVAVGIAGPKVDLDNFAEVMVRDFERRCNKLARQVYHGRVQVLPLPEEAPPPTEVRSRDEV